MSRVAVIGAGIFGSVIARTLVRDGHEVVLFDDQKPGSGSAPAACLMKPSWFASSMASKEADAALSLLDDLYGVADLSFTLRPTRAQVTVHWTSPRLILSPVVSPEEYLLHVHATVDRVIENGGGSWQVSGFIGDKRCTSQHVHKVIVAAGVWCNDILVSRRAQEPEALHVKGLTGKAGSAFLFPNAFVSDSTAKFIAPWAPYKQIVGFDRGDGYWVGDGQAIKSANWTEVHSKKSFSRCALALGEPEDKTMVFKELHGLRPYVPGAKPCYLKEHHPGVWVCTGGAKNGTIAAAWAANELSRRLM